MNILPTNIFYRLIAVLLRRWSKVVTRVRPLVEDYARKIAFLALQKKSGTVRMLKREDRRILPADPLHQQEDRGR